MTVLRTAKMIKGNTTVTLCTKGVHGKQEERLLSNRLEGEPLGPYNVQVMLRAEQSRTQSMYVSAKANSDTTGGYWSQISKLSKVGGLSGTNFCSKFDSGSSCHAVKVREIDKGFEEGSFDPIGVQTLLGSRQNRTGSSVWRFELLKESHGNSSKVMRFWLALKENPPEEDICSLQ